MTHTPARRCSECPRPVGAWRRFTCSDACAVTRQKRRAGERHAAAWAARHPIPQFRPKHVQRKALENRVRNHWRRKADARDARDAERRAA